MIGRVRSARWRHGYPRPPTLDTNRVTLAGISAIGLASRPKRLLAYLIDIILLAVGFVVPVALLATRGLMLPGDGIGSLVAYIIWPAYFIVSESQLMGGQTLGKRLMGIAVVRQTGGYLSLPRAILRTLPLAFIWNSSAIARVLPADLMATPGASMVFGLASLGMCLGVFVLPLVLPQRRGLRDLLAGSIVVNKNAGAVSRRAALRASGAGA
jgi:uncharacterized RDD family membrane protein YckC